MNEIKSGWIRIPGKGELEEKVGKPLFFTDYLFFFFNKVVLLLRVIPKQLVKDVILVNASNKVKGSWIGL